MRLLISLILIFVARLISAQTTPSQVNIDTRLYEVYDKAYLENLQENNPFLLQRWAFYLDNAWYLSDYPTGKGKMSFPTVNIKDIKNINILLLEKEQNIHKEWKKIKAYQIEGTDKLLVYYSGETFQQKLNTFLGRKQPNLKRGVRL